MEEPEGKFCVNCEHIGRRRELGVLVSVCGHSAALKHDRVTGTAYRLDCNKMRYGGLCGEHGEFFEKLKR